MLCPKCGFISFDNLLICGKCNNDLTAVGHELRGTAASVESLLFLGAVLKDAGAISGAVAADAVAPTAAEVGNAGGDEGMTLIVDEEPPALEFDESEIPHMEDSASAEATLEAPVAPIPPAGSTVEGIVMAAGLPEAAELAAAEPEPVTLAVEEEIGALTLPGAPGAVEDVAEALTIDEFALSLEPVEGEVPPSVPEGSKSDEDATGQLTLDLDEIDLSDLTATSAAQAKTGGAEAANAESDSESVSFDEMMDLSLIIGEEADHTGGDEVKMGSAGSDLSPVDLTMVDDALVELTVDTSLDNSSSVGAGERGDEVELFMETSEK